MARLPSSPRFFVEPDWTRFLALPGAENQQAEHVVSQLYRTGPHAWRFVLLDLLLQGVVPALLGLYLMRSDNLAVRFCYPRRPDAQTAGIPDASSADSPAEPESRAELPSSGESRYAPPGYR